MRNWMKWAALALTALGAAPLSSSAPAGPEFPGLIENEYVFPIAGGCSLVATVVGTPEEVRKALSGDNTGTTWSGDCRTGFANGPGSQTVRNQYGTYYREINYVYGRPTYPIFDRGQTGTDGVRKMESRFVYLRGADYLIISNLTGFAKADWRAGKISSIAMAVAGVPRITDTYTAECTSWERRTFKGCRIGATVYGVSVIIGSTRVFTPCPDMHSPVGCEDVWVRMAAPIVAEAKVLIKTFDDENAALHARLDPFAAQGEAIAQQRQAAAEAERQRAAAAERARQAAADQKARDDAAARARADQAFQSSLNTLGAGELFAKADEYRRAGDMDRANQLLRALIRRFPNSPLVAVAAQQLSETSGPTSSTRSAPPVASNGTGGGTARAAKSCEDHLWNLYQTINAGQTPNEVSTAASGEYDVWVRQEFIRLARALPSSICSPTDIARTARTLPDVQQKCRQYGGRNCDQGADYRAPQYRQASQRAFDQTLAEARSGGGGGTAVASTAPPAATSACLRTPDQELANFNTDLQNLTRQHPMPSSEAGARATYQYSYAYSLRALQLLEPRRACMGQHYQPNYDALVNMRDSAKRGCDQLSSSSAICPKELP